MNGKHIFLFIENIIYSYQQLLVQYRGREEQPTASTWGQWPHMTTQGTRNRTER